MLFIETQFQDAVKKASIVSIANTKGIITFVNENFVQISGYPEPELIGQSHRIINSGYHPKSFWVEMWQTISSGKIWRNEVRNKARDGSIYWVDTHVIPFFDQDGKITEYLSIRNDITARKAAEEEISKLSDIVKFTTNAVIITNKAGHITWVNEGFERITGYVLQEISGKKPGDFLQGPETDKTTIKFMSEKLQNSEGFRADVLNYTKAGLKYWMDIDVRPMIHDGTITGFMALQTNITEKKEYELKLKESEERLSLAIDAANLGLWDWSIESDVNVTNKRWFEMLGYKEGEIQSSLSAFQNFVHTDDLPFLLNVIQKHIDGETGYLECEYRVKHKSGKYIWICSRGRIVSQSEENKNLRMLGTNQDITETKEITKKLEANQAELQRLLDEKDLLIKEIHHRVKNNLQMVSSVLFLKAQNLDDNVSKNILLETRQRIRSMAIIHERLMQSGGQITQVDVHEYIISLIEELKQINYYPESEICYETEIDHHLMNLEQVINIGFIVNEIVTNTVKHAFPNNEKGIIIISFKVFEDYLELKISDDGIGLPQYKLSEETEFFGIELVKVFTKNLKGHLFIETENGTSWTIRLNNHLQEQSHSSHGK